MTIRGDICWRISSRSWVIRATVVRRWTSHRITSTNTRRKPWARICLLFPSKLLEKIKFPISFSISKRRLRVGSVQFVDINVIRLQPRKAGVYLMKDMTTRESTAFVAGASHRVTDFRRDDGLTASALQGFTKNRLGDAPDEPRQRSYPSYMSAVSMKLMPWSSAPWTMRSAFSGPTGLPNVIVPRQRRDTSMSELMMRCFCNVKAYSLMVGSNGSRAVATGSLYQPAPDWSISSWCSRIRENSHPALPDGLIVAWLVNILSVKILDPQSPVANCE